MCEPNERHEQKIEEKYSFNWINSIIYDLSGKYFIPSR